MKRVALVTGGTDGIGKQTAIELNKYGFKVYAAGRNISKIEELRNIGITPILLDVTNEQSMLNCVSEIITKENKIDILVNCAGYGSYGAVEDVPISEAKRQLEVNLFGLARMCQLVLPSMRKQHYGKIVNITSMGGKIWTKFGAWYHASKFAVEGFSDCLRMETKPFGIDVIIVEPGGIKTNWGIIAAENLKKVSSNGAYKDLANEAAKGMVKNYSGNMLSKPTLIAKTIRKAVMKRTPKTRYLVGFMAKPMVMTKNIFGDKAYDAFIKRFG